MTPISDPGVADAVDKLARFADLDAAGLYRSWWSRVRRCGAPGQRSIAWEKATAEGSDWRAVASGPGGACVAVRDGEEAVFEPGDFRAAALSGWVTDVRLLRWRDDSWYWRRGVQPFDPLGRRFRARLYVHVAADFGPRLLTALSDRLDADGRPFDGKAWCSDVEERRDGVVLWVPLSEVAAAADVVVAAAADVEALLGEPPTPTLRVRQVGVATDPARAASYGHLMATVAAHALALGSGDMRTDWAVGCRAAGVDPARPWRLHDRAAERLWVDLERTGGSG